MPDWLNEVLSDIPNDAHWATRRRMAILKRWPLSRQAEAQADYAVGKSALRDQMINEISAIKEAIPNGLPASLPQVVSRFQAFAALDDAGLLNTVEALMSNPATPSRAKLAWATAQEFERGSPTIAALAGQIGLTEEQIDQIFIAAAGIKA